MNKGFILTTLFLAMFLISAYSYGSITGNVVNENLCGDGVVNSAFEECDGSDYGQFSRECRAHGYVTGVLRCTDNCRISYDGCFPQDEQTCGNGITEPSEDCEPNNFITASCEEYFPNEAVGGVVRCANDCRFDTSECIWYNPDGYCDDGVCNGQENSNNCPGDCPNSTSACRDRGTGSLNVVPGRLTSENTVVHTIEVNNAPNMVDAIAFDLMYDKDIMLFDGIVNRGDCANWIEFGCNEHGSREFVRCGAFTLQPAIERGESCDFIKLRFKVNDICPTSTSHSVDFLETFDDVKNWDATNGCFNCDSSASACGDGLCNAQETIDTCPEDCDTTGFCGDGELNSPNEECDVYDFGQGSFDCSDYGYESGMVTCSENCQLEFDSCDNIREPYCGDGILNPIEECEPQLFEPVYCSEVYENSYGGYVTCNNDCTLNADSCMFEEEQNAANYQIKFLTPRPNEELIGEVAIIVNAKGTFEINEMRLKVNGISSVRGLDFLGCNPAPSDEANPNLYTSRCNWMFNVDEYSNVPGRLPGELKFTAHVDAYDQVSARLRITENSCGDGICMDNEDARSCPSDCEPQGSLCGDGLVQAGEECDSDNLGQNSELCSMHGYYAGDVRCRECRLDFSECILDNSGRCGDGIVNQNSEECDDGNLRGGDGCSLRCKREYCGDGMLMPGLQEECDDGNLINGDGCSSNCIEEALSTCTINFRDNCPTDLSECGARFEGSGSCTYVEDFETLNCGNAAYTSYVVPSGSTSVIRFEGGISSLRTVFAGAESGASGNMMFIDSAGRVIDQTFTTLGVCGADIGNPRTVNFNTKVKTIIIRSTSGNIFLADFTVNPSDDPRCGDGVVNLNGEVCDMNDFDGRSVDCRDYSGFTEGTVSCDDDCMLDFSTCSNGPSCGNDVLDPGEDCEPSNFVAEFCEVKFPADAVDGLVRCSQDCSYDTTDCVWRSSVVCGNNLCEEGETENTCPEDCDISPFCGNDVLDPGEDCEPSNFVAEFCEVKFPADAVDGLVRCSQDCSYDTTDCVWRSSVVCGNNVCEEGETISSCPSDCSDEISICNNEGTGDINIRTARARASNQVVHTVEINNAPNEVDAISFDLSYDKNILKFDSIADEGDCADWMEFGCTEHDSEEFVRCGAFKLGPGIREGDSCEFVSLRFNVADICPSTNSYELDFKRLFDDIVNWDATNGCFYCLQ